jgi:hypothetical protein
VPLSVRERGARKRTSGGRGGSGGSLRLRLPSWEMLARVVISWRGSGPPVLLFAEVGWRVIDGAGPVPGGLL